MEFRTIGIGELMLNLANPRHEIAQSQNDVIQALIDAQGQKLTALARDIVARGLSPIERMLVVKTGRTYTVMEGNRRLVVLKLLHNPRLAEGTSIESEIKKIAHGATLPDAVDCAVLSDAEAETARHWMEIRHRGEAGGAGTVPWDTLQAHRFAHRPGTQAAKAITFIDALQSAYPKNTEMQGLLTTVAAQRLTTLGRLVADPALRDRTGLQEADGGLVSHYPADDLEAIFMRILTDVATHLSVTNLKTKGQRADYLGTVPKPKKANYQAVPRQLQPSKAASPARATKLRARKPAAPFKGIELGKLGDRIEAIHQELVRLDLDRFPNAAALMTRALVELSVDQVYEKKDWRKTQNTELKTRIRQCLRAVDPSEKDAKYQAVRTGLQDGSSLLAIATLHGYVHNPDFHPTSSEIRRIASNYAPFLQALNDLA